MNFCFMKICSELSFMNWFIHHDTPIQAFLNFIKRLNFKSSKNCIILVSNQMAFFSNFRTHICSKKCIVKQYSLHIYGILRLLLQCNNLSENSYIYIYLIWYCLALKLIKYWYILTYIFYIVCSFLMCDNLLLAAVLDCLNLDNSYTAIEKPW